MRWSAEKGSHRQLRSPKFDEVREMVLEGVAFTTDTQPEIVEENAPSRDPG